MLTAITVCTRLAWRHPVAARTMVIAVVLGALGGTIPSGFLVLSDGAGVGTGATWGLWLFAVCSPLLVVYASASLCAARYEWQVDRDLFLAGQSHARTLIPDGVAALSVALAAVVPAAVGGAFLGLFDALARHAPPLTGLSAIALLAAIASACWWSLLVVLLVGITRDATVTYVAILAILLGGLATVQITDAQAVWDLLCASPLAPFALVAGRVMSSRHGLVTDPMLVTLGSALWPLLFAWFVWRRHRHLPPKLARNLTERR